MRSFKDILLALILTVLFLPKIQEAFEPVRPGKLTGAYIKAPSPHLTWKSWKKGWYQDSLGVHVNDSLPLRPYLVRINNQVDYSLFRILHGEEVVLGKRSNLFLMEYIKGYLGIGYPSKQFISDKAMKCKKVQEFLWNEKHIFFLVVMAPDKATYMPEDIPDRFLAMGGNGWGRDYLAEQLRANGVHVIDFMPVFSQMKDTSKYPLFVKTGIHWTDYGSFIAADSMFKYITAKSGYRFPGMTMDRIEVTKNPRHDDADVDRLLNLALPTSTTKYAYPVITYETDTDLRKPAALFVGDSFYWGLFNQGIIQNMFSNLEFWFYDNLIFPESFSGNKSAKSVDLLETVYRQNIIVLLYVEGGWGNPGTGFVDRVFMAIDTSTNNEIRAIEKAILENPKWYELVKSKAEAENVPVASKVRSEAIYMYNQRIIHHK